MEKMLFYFCWAHLARIQTKKWIHLFLDKPIIIHEKLSFMMIFQSNVRNNWIVIAGVSFRFYVRLNVHPHLWK